MNTTTKDLYQWRDMKFDKNKRISLPTPTAKPAHYLSPKPRNVGGFALLTEEFQFRHKIFLPDDLVRISYNQRYVQDPSQIQIISIAEEIPNERRFMGNHYLVNRHYLKYITKIPEGTKIRIMSKEYPPPVNTVLEVVSHSKGIVKVEYNNQIIAIKDCHIEGIPSIELEQNIERALYDGPAIERPPRYRFTDDLEDCIGEDEPHDYPEEDDFYRDSDNNDPVF